MRQQALFLALSLLLCPAIRAQHRAMYTFEDRQSVYINTHNRTRIVSSVDSIHYGPDTTMTVRSGRVATTFGTRDVSLVSLQERDSWRAQVMPDSCLADFDYNIVFSGNDQYRSVPEPEVTDPNDPLYDDFLSHSTWTRSVNIHYQDTTVSITGDTDSLTITRTGAHVTIHTAAAGVVYHLGGTSRNGSFNLYSDKKACVMLFGAQITNPHGPVINSQGKKRLYLVVLNDYNTLTDGCSYTKVQGEDRRGCIFAEGKICISGYSNSQLIVNANKKCGIASDDYVHLLSGWVQVFNHAQKGKAVYGKDNVIIGGGVLRTYNDGDAGKGVASDSLLTVRGGLVKAITAGGAVWDETEQDYSSACGIKSEYAMTLSGGEIQCLSTGTGGKGISSGSTLTIANTDIYVRTAGKRIPEVKTEDAHGQTAEAAASPKGIKAAGKITVHSGNIYVRCSGGAAAEGIESKKTIEINGGKIRSYCVDDGMNAEGCHINGGDVLICSTENDGFDVSFLYMNGGKLYTVGGDIDQMGLDTDGKTFKVSGGEIVAMGARNCQPFASSTQASVLCYVKKNICGLALADANGNIIRAIPTPVSYNTVCGLFSNAAIQVGSSYKIFSYATSFNDTPVTEYEFTVETTSTVLGSYK